MPKWNGILQHGRGGSRARSICIDGYGVPALRADAAARPRVPPEIASYILSFVLRADFGCNGGSTAALPEQQPAALTITASTRALAAHSSWATFGEEQGDAVRGCVSRLPCAQYKYNAGDDDDDDDEYEEPRQEERAARWGAWASVPEAAAAAATAPFEFTTFAPDAAARVPGLFGSLARKAPAANPYSATVARLPWPSEGHQAGYQL